MIIGGEKLSPGEIGAKAGAAPKTSSAANRLLQSPVVCTEDLANY